jgi:hypothetical protein
MGGRSGKLKIIKLFKQLEEQLMNHKEFDEISSNILEKAAALRVIKAAHYATDKDRLANFEKAAKLTGDTVQASIAGMMVKHTVSIYDMVDEQYGQLGVPVPHMEIEMWEEKICDHINYLLLLYASIRGEV